MHLWSKRSAVALVILAGVPALAASCADDQPQTGDSRYGQTSSPLTISSDISYFDFNQNAPDPTAISLTFDDGPDTNGNTASVLDTLKAKGVKATFFINTKNYSDVANDSTAQALVRRMLAEGHELGSHTVDHKDLSLSSTDVPSEFQGVDDLLHTIAPSYRQHRLARAPFGNPYFGPQSRLDYVAPIVANYGVHIGWNIDSLDWQCQDNGQGTSCVRNNVLSAVDAGNSGIVLMHCVNPLTASVLPSLIDDLRSRGKHFVQVESLVQAKYGDLSRHLFFCSATSDCVNGESCVNQHCAVGTTSGDAGTTDTGSPDTGVVDSGVADTGVSDTGVSDTGVSDTGTGGGGSSTLTCSSFTVMSGSITGTAAACSGSPAVLASNDSAYLEFNPSTSTTKADGYATYLAPVDASQVTAITVDVAFRGDDKTESPWLWYALNAKTGAWDLLGDNSWAASWTTTTHTFTLASASSYVDASRRILVRFTTKASTNNAELNQMIVHVASAASSGDAGTGGDAGADTSTNDSGVMDSGTADTGTTDTGTADTGTADTGTTDTGTTDTGSTTDTGTTDSGGTPVTDTLTCSSITTVSGALYGNAATACSGATPALAAIDGQFVGWSGQTGTTKSSAYVTYVSRATASAVTAMNLDVGFRGDDKTELLWYWYVKNVNTGAWDLVGDNSWASSWTTTSHTFSVASPSRYVAADRTVQILFTTSSSTNDAELEQMTLRVTH